MSCTTIELNRKAVTGLEENPTDVREECFVHSFSLTKFQ